MMREAQHRGHEIWAATPKDLKFLNNKVIVSAEQLKLNEKSKVWYEVMESKDLSSSSLDGIIMRKDPPFDMEYVYSTYYSKQWKMKDVGCLIDPKAYETLTKNLP